MLLRSGVVNKLYTKIFVVPEVPQREPQELPHPQAEPLGPQGQQRRPSINGLVNTAVLWFVWYAYGKSILECLCGLQASLFLPLSRRNHLLGNSPFSVKL